MAQYVRRTERSSVQVKVKVNLEEATKAHRGSRDIIIIIIIFINCNWVVTRWKWLFYM